MAERLSIKKLRDIPLLDMDPDDFDIDLVGPNAPSLPDIEDYLERNNRYKVRFNDAMVGAIELAFQLKLAPFPRSYLAKTFPYIYTDNGHIRKIHFHDGFAFRDPDHKILTIDGKLLCGMESGDQSPYSLQQLEHVYNTKTFTHWRDITLYFYEDPCSSEEEDGESGDGDKKGGSSFAKSKGKHREDDEEMGGEDEGGDRKGGSSFAKSKGKHREEDEEMPDIFDGIDMTITPTTKNLVVEIAELRDALQKEKAQNTCLEDKVSGLQHRLRHTEKCIHDLMKSSVAGHINMMSQLSDATIRLAEVIHEKVPDAGDRFLDECSRISAKAVHRFQQKKMAFAEHIKTSTPMDVGPSTLSETPGGTTTTAQEAVSKIGGETHQKSGDGSPKQQLEEGESSMQGDMQGDIQGDIHGEDMMMQ